MSINDKLTWVNTMLQSPFPDASEASVTRADLGVWQAALSRVEARMMFIGALSPSILKQGRVPPLTGDIEPLTLQTLNSVVDVLDDISFAAVHDPSSLSSPIHQGFSNLLAFKSDLTGDPVLRAIVGAASQALATKEKKTFPSISAVSDDDNVRRSLYRAYSFYGVNMDLVSFSEGVIQSIRFKREWAESDESVVYSLLAYIVKNNKLQSLPGIEKIAERGSEQSPLFKTVLGLTKAIR